MTEQRLDRTTLHDWLPHRGLNLFLDEVVIADGAKKASSTTSIGPGDPRQIFSQEYPGGITAWYPPFLFELLALTGVTLVKPHLAPNGVAVFSAISNVVIQAPVPMFAAVRAQSELVRLRTGFHQHKAQILINDQAIFSGDIMSGEVDSSVLAKSRIPEPLPATCVGEAVPAYPWKHPRTRFIDTLTAFDAALGKIECAYTYPADHPFVPGHFPGGPIMMGVTQLAAACDAGSLALARMGMKKGTINGEIVRPSGEVIFTVKDLVMELTPIPILCSMSRCTFRALVVPGDGILVRLTVTPA
jgi:3-hydroxymyristoyl/3-hydroxydecanoyl-(acyl carrier protein) dehydratase